MSQELKRAYYEPVPPWMQKLTMMGARFVEGNNGEGEQGTPPAPTPPTDPPESTDPEPKGLDKASEDELRAEITKLRRENAKDRTSAKEAAAQEATQSLVDKLASALGINDEQPTAEDLTAQLEASQAAQRQQAVEFAAYKQATDLGVDAKLLLNQRSFHQAVADLDPESQTFDDDLKAIVEAEKKDYPYLSKQAPGKSGNELNQHRGHDGSGGGSKSPEELAASITRNNPY